MDISFKRLLGENDRGQLFRSALFGLIILSMITIGALCLKGALGWIDKPFAGFLTYQYPVVGTYGDYQWAGMRAGLRYRDIIVEADGRQIFSGTEVQEVAGRTLPGSPIHYVYERKGVRNAVDVVVTTFTFTNFLNIFGITFASGIVFWIIGTIVYILKRDTPVAWVFLLFCFFVGTYLVTGFTIQSSHSHWSWYIVFFVIAFFPATGVHLALLFPEKARMLDRRPWLQYLPYLLSSAVYISFVRDFVALMAERSSTQRVVNLSLHLLNTVQVGRLYALVAALTIVGLSAYAYWRSSSRIAKQRARIILLSAGAAFLPPTLIQTAVSFSKAVIPFNLSALTLTVFPAAIGYAIARHNLFDVDVFIKRTVGYVMMTIIVGTTYFVVQVVLRKFVLDPMFGAQAEHVYPIVFALLVVFFFNPISRRVQENVDKLFFRKQYDYKTAVAKVTDALSMTIDVNDIIHRTVGVLRKEMFVDSAGVVLLDDRKRECRSLFIMDGQVKGHEESKDLCLDYEDPLLALLAKEKKLITKYDVAEDPQYVTVRESCGQRFEAMGASLALPLFSHDHVTGVLALGYKKSGHFYNREDIDLLKTVSSMTSTAIEQAREKGEKQMVMQLFSKHVSPEVAEAVWNEREQFLEGGRPKSQKLMVTVLFTDLKGFSTVSERMDPQSLMNWLNGYMDKMAKIVMDHGGVVDDYFGDAIKSNFGVPLPRTTEAQIRQDAVNAITCALAMEQEMRRLNLGMRAQDLPTLRMRVGIYTGAVVAGSLGSADRLKYTTIGDAVNTASRLESFDKDLVLPHLEESPCRILIGESTLRYLDDQFETQPVGELTLKGKDKKIKAYCVVGPANRNIRSALAPGEKVT